MNSESPEHDPLEAWLRQNAAPPLADDGFSQRVLAALPSRRAAPSPWRSWAPAAVGAAAGLAFVLFRGGDATGIQAIASSLENLAGSGADLLFLPDYGFVLALAVMVLVVALDTDEGIAE